MKKLLTYIFSLFSLIIISVFSCCAADQYTIKNVNITAQPQINGDADIMSEWTVEFGSARSDGFECEIPIPTSDEYKFASVENISADIDSSNASLSEEASTDIDGGFADYTYTLSESDSAIKVKWNIKSFGVTHTFTLSYTLSSVVKNIDSQNVFYCSYIPESVSPKCENVTITIKLPSDCSGKDVGLLTANNYKCRREANSVIFTGGKTNSAADIGVSIPSEKFTSLLSYTTSPEGWTGGKTAAVTIACVVALTIILCLIFSKRIMISSLTRSCRKNHYLEPSEKEIDEAIKALGPAQILKTVSPNVYNEADLFIYTVLFLAQRGILIKHKGAILPSGEGGNLRKYEKAAVEFFTGNEAKSSARFYKFINKFNRKVKGLSPFECIFGQKRKICRTCFQIALTAESYDGIKAQSISDDVFKPGKISDADLIRFMFKENDGKTHVSDGLFLFREVYEDGFEDILKEKKHR